MAILNVVGGNPVLPRTMWLTLRAESAAGDALAAAPASLGAPGGNGHVTAAKSGIEKLGLRKLIEGKGDPALASYAGFVATLRPLVMAPDAGEADDLRDALAWLMTQSPTVPLSWGDNVQRLAPPGVFTNDVRWTAFRYWARDLGFANSAGLIAGDDGGLVPNPTRAVLDTLAHPSWPLARGSALDIWSFLEALQSLLPVLPRIDRAKDRDPIGEPGSWALIGAHHRGWLKLIPSADIRRVFLSDPDDTRDGWRTVTHVTLTGRGDE